jgi:hypothetical protein
MARSGMGIDAAIGHLKSQLGMLGSSSESMVPATQKFTHGTLSTQLVRHKPPFKLKPIVPGTAGRTK